MILTIVILLSLVIGFFIIWKNKEHIDDEIKWKIGFGILFSALSFVGFVLISVFLTRSITTEKTYTMEIISLRDNSGINGRFVLGCGTINSVDYYVSYMRNSDGGYERIRFNVDESVIYEDSSVSYANNPIVVIHYSTAKFPWVWFLGNAKDFDKDLKYDIHVPINTIISKFEVK